jgi:outer membrane protein
MSPRHAILKLGGMIALTSAAISAGPASATTLQDALAQAYLNNPTILAERARLRATDEGVPQALSNWRPTVTISGDVAKERRDTTIVETENTINRTPRGYGITVTQSLYRGGRTTAATKRADAEVQANRARLSAAEQTVLLAAATAYVNVVRGAEVVKLRINNEKVLQRQLEATQDRFRVGEVTRTDVAQAESRVEGAKAERVSAEGDLVAARAVYKNVITKAPADLEAAKPLANLASSEEEAVNLARKGNFTVIEADYDERAAKLEIREINGELLPTLSLTGDIDERYDTSGKDSDILSASITASVSIPLYQSGSVASRVRAAKQTAAQLRNERNQAVRDAVEGATRAWEALATARAQIASFESQIKASTIALEGVQQEALVGSRTVLDVLDAEQELLDARVSLVRAERDQIVATFQLREATGQLTAKSLSLPVTYYDPERHYRSVRGRWFGTRIRNQ